MSDSLISMAIEELSETEFEKFAQFAVQKVHGIEFEPSGGMHDGGLDGYYRAVGDTAHFMQASKQETISSKIRSTIKRIKETREIKRLTYVSSRIIGNRDILEGKIYNDTGVEVIIHSNSWLQLQCQFHEDLKTYLFKLSRDFINQVKQISDADETLTTSGNLSIVTYMEAQASSLDSSEEFHTLCLDSLIYEVLEGTDPSLDQLLDEKDIEKGILGKYPNSIKNAGVSLSERLKYLSSKDNKPRIRNHQGRYGLPFDVRNDFSENNIKIRKSEDDFVASVNLRITEEASYLEDNLRAIVLAAVRHTVTETYRQQAMNFITSFNKLKPDNDIQVFEIIDSFIRSQNLESEDIEICRDVIALIIRNVFYSSNDVERGYIYLLMKYFTVHFLMDGDVAVKNYFTDMAKKLRLYVGTDIIVRMLSEALLRPENRATSNAIKLLRQSGVKVYLTRQILAEVYKHIKYSHNEFVTNHMDYFRHATLDQTKHFDQILIRAFYYAFLEPEKHTRKPRNWRVYLSEFGNANWYRRDASNLDDFGSFLTAKFGFNFIEDNEVREKLDQDVLAKLTDKLLEMRYVNNPTASTVLAANDAEMVLFIDAMRKQRKEKVGADIYGLCTWWLTEEALVLRAARKMNLADNVVMNPQFLINHYFIDPQIKDRGSDVADLAMPTTFGLRITNRVSPEQMDKFKDEISDIAELDVATIRARIRSASNHLKAT